MPETLYRYEMHLHTSEASLCGRNTGAEMVRAAAEAGYTGLVVTDHFLNGNSCIDPSLSWETKMRLFYKGYENARIEGEKLGLDVFFGMEFGAPPTGKEFLTYGIDFDFLLSSPDLLKIPIAEYCRRVREYGGCVIQAHPFREAPYIDPSVLPVPEMLDGMEVYNYGNWNPEWNQKALDFAKRHNMRMTAGSDTHNVGNMGHAGLAFYERLKTPDRLVQALLSGRYRLIVEGTIQED